MRGKFICIFTLILIGVVAFIIGKYSCSKKKGMCLHFIQDCPSFPKDTARSFDEQNKKPIVKVKLYNMDGVTLPSLPMLYDVLSEIYTIEYNDTEYDVLIDGRVTPKSPLPHDDSVKIFYTWESITPVVENYDLAIGFDFIDRPNYIRVPLYYVFYKDLVSTDFNRGKCEPAKKVNFASFLITNYGYHNKLDGCIARNRMFHKLSLYKTVASGGKALNNWGAIVPIPDTFAWVAKSKFMISYENVKHNGYMTEKPFQAYIGGAIPIWYGDRKALEGINPKAIIYADDFESEDALVEYVQKLDNDDELYCKTWNEKLITDKSQNYSEVKANLKAKMKALIDRKILK